MTRIIVAIIISLALISATEKVIKSFEQTADTYIKFSEKQEQHTQFDRYFQYRVERINLENSCKNGGQLHYDNQDLPTNLRCYED